MATTHTTRKTRFRKALAASQLSQAAFARLNKLSPAHLSLVLNGKRESETLTAKIDAFIKGKAA
jgi:transcriptional regulator with XRE-family HTH domain